MVEIISVPPHAKLEAIRRRLAQGGSRRVALWLPESWLELNNVAQMRLLQRQAQVQQRHLALITRHEATRKIAGQLGIPVFATEEDAQRGKWQMGTDFPRVDPQRPQDALPEPPPWRRADIVARHARPSHHQARQNRIRIEIARRRELPLWLQMTGYTLIGGLLLLVLGGFVRFVLPAATITLVPGHEPFNVEVSLLADGNLDQIDPDENALPARFIETTMERTGTISTTGTAQRGNVRSTGQVVFTNLGSAPVGIPSGTVVGTSTGTQVEFRTTREVELPGGVGQRVTAPIEAVEPGVEGNVRANTINTINGALRFRMRVVNPSATVGGNAELVPTVTQEDKDNLLARLQSEIEEEAHSELQTLLEPGEWVPRESIQTFVVGQEFDKFNDDEASELSLNLRMLVQGTALDQQQTNDAVLTALRRNVPQNAMLIADSVTVQPAQEVTAIGRQLQFTMTANAEYVVPIDPDEVKSMVAGMEPQRAMAAINTRWQLAQTPQLYRDPEWLGTLPAFPSRIQVRVEYAESLASAP